MQITVESPRVLLVVPWSLGIKRVPDWPTGWPIPRVGDEVCIPSFETLQVERVEWWPIGEYEGGTPSIYIHLKEPAEGESA